MSATSRVDAGIPATATSKSRTESFADSGRDGGVYGVAGAGLAGRQDAVLHALAPCKAATIQMLCAIQG
ncbi:hypothetical protein XcodCFBP4690_15540 [Xanthomonas codiaei]|uniref:Uncharacterized protein n=1 Tax=Xanthomonas codiaei TaxID=56463 RepID=A0A2S7CJQ7_9XANT|nr:hypothetical protein XcodCFBP4690_15540 [Xanthomonas codiaei]